MERISRLIVRKRKWILLIAFLLLIPSVFGMVNTRINYDILNYLPKDIDTMKGQDILQKDFGKGAFSLVVVEGMPEKDVKDLADSYQNIPHVASVISYDSLLSPDVPKEILPQKMQDAFVSGDATLLAVFFDEDTSGEGTMKAIQTMRSMTKEKVFISGMSAIVLDTKCLTEEQMGVYVAIAVAMCALVLAIFMDSVMLPLLFLTGIGMTILYNMGTNFLQGQISFITQAIAAVLQLGVTMDYSIFLWHSYKEIREKNGRLGTKEGREEDMAKAITETISSVLGSSITTIAGFVALMFMSFTLGLDMGIVMAKGVALGVLGCVTILPALILTFENLIVKTSHKSLLPDMRPLAKRIVAHYPVFLILFVILLIPAFYGYRHTDVYYKLDSTLPKNLPSVVANQKLSETFEMNSTHMLLYSSKLPSGEVMSMKKEMEQVDGVKAVLGEESVKGSLVPEEILPKSIVEKVNSGKEKLMIISSSYETATDEVGRQVTALDRIAKRYDASSLLIGEAPCTKDLINITNHDFSVVNTISIAAIFLIILLNLKSLSLPVILVMVIELAIFINLGLPFYTKTTLAFIASIVISTIQLGSTVDYAILMTSRYKKERMAGKEKQEAVENALATSIPSIIVSALGFFAATFGVGLYSTVDMISSLCSLMARGAIISMFTVILMLPSMFMAFDGLIVSTTQGFHKEHHLFSHKLAHT